MLVSVTFYVGMRGDCECWLCSAGKEISQEEGDCRLSPSSTMLLGLVLFGCCSVCFLVCFAKMRYVWQGMRLVMLAFR